MLMSTANNPLEVQSGDCHTGVAKSLPMLLHFSQWCDSYESYGVARVKLGTAVHWSVDPGNVTDGLKGLGEYACKA